MEPPISTPRSLITSLFNALTGPPPPSAQPIETESPNPLVSLPPSHRALLTTLHVLLPPGMLLQALDLLDRGLVTKLIYLGEEDTEGYSGSLEERREKDETAHHPPNIDIQQEAVIASSPPPPPPNHRPRPPKMSIYKVRSSQATSRFSSTAAPETTLESYTAHLNAWNCSCAAFAFNAFPPATSSAAPWLLPGDFRDLGEEYQSGYGAAGGGGDGSRGDGRSGDDERRKWEFGGLRSDGVGNRDGVPLCKHLLACVLVERWEDVLGRFVEVRVVGREEMAGLGGEG